MEREHLSIFLAIISIIVVIGLTSANVIRFSDISSAIAYALIAGIIGVLIWGFKSRIIDNIENTKNADTSNDPLESVKSNKPTVNEPKKLNHKTMKLRVDNYDDIRLDLKRKTRITGKISSDGFFNIYFLTESSYRSFKNENNFKYDGSEEVSHFQVNFEASRKGTYYIVIENADKKNIVVEVELYV